MSNSVDIEILQQPFTAEDITICTSSSYISLLQEGQRISLGDDGEMTNHTMMGDENLPDHVFLDERGRCQRGLPI